MKCPTYAETWLVMTDRQGVEIDYCPQYRRLWMIRGELDNLSNAPARRGQRLAAALQPAHAPPSRNPSMGMTMSIVPARTFGARNRG